MSSTTENSSHTDPRTARDRPPGRIERRSSWTSLGVHRTLPVEERPDGWALEVVSGGKGDPRAFMCGFGHTWIRLIDPSGGVISVGFFPDESTALDPERRPGRRMPGMLLHPDKYDGLRYASIATRLMITEAHHAALIRHVESLQAGRARGSLEFCILDRSCVAFCVDIAARVGVDVDARYDLVRAGFDSLPDPVRRRIPERVRRRFESPQLWRGSVGAVAERIYGVVTNVGLALSGGRSVVREEWVRASDGSVVSREVTGVSPLFERWRDVFGAPVPFFHVRPLIRWQRTWSAHEDAPDADPPDRREHDPAETGRDRQERVVPAEQT